MNKSKVLKFPNHLSFVKDANLPKKNHEIELQKVLLYQHKSIAVYDNKIISIIPISSLMYIQSYSSYTTFYLKCGRSIITCKSLIYWYDKINDPHFLRCHNSYLINCKYVKSIDLKSSNLLIHKAEIPISRSKRTEIMDCFG